MICKMEFAWSSCTLMPSSSTATIANWVCCAAGSAGSSATPPQDRRYIGRGGLKGREGQAANIILTAIGYNLDRVLA